MNTHNTIETHQKNNKHFAPCKLSHIFVVLTPFTDSIRLAFLSCFWALCFSFDTYFYKCFVKYLPHLNAREKTVECIERVVKFQRVNHFTDHLSNNSDIVELWLFSRISVSFSFYLSLPLSLNFSCDKYCKWKMTAATFIIMKAFCFVRFNFGFCFYSRKIFRNHVPFNSLHSLLSISSLAMHR